MIRSVLAQILPSITTLTDAYIVAQNRIASLGAIVITNQANTNASCRVSIALAGSADDLKQYIIYDLELCPNETIDFTLPLILNKTDVIRVYSSSGSISFNILGS